MQKGKYFEALFCPWLRDIVNFDLVDAFAVFIDLGVALLIIVTPWGSPFVIKILLIDFWQVHFPMIK